MQKTKAKRGKISSVAEVNLTDGKILYDSVLIKPIIVKQEGLVLRPQQYEDKPEWGEVIMCGEGRLFDNGESVPLKVKVGDIVLFQKYSAQKFRHNGTDYMVIREEDIYLVYEVNRG